MSRILTSRRRPIRPARDSRVVPFTPHVKGALPGFSKPMGLDWIITEQGRVYLVELQHGFGRKGLLHLWPKLAKHYRKTHWRLRRELGKCWEVTEGLRLICHDKITTYKHFPGHQPRSFVYKRWGPKVETWLEGLDCEFLLAKPPLGSCGEGILVLNREAFLRSAGAVQLGRANLLQEYIESRLLPDPLGGGGHVGCIRHIVILMSDGEHLTFMHLPPYWRVAPDALVRDAESGTLTANISRGAFALPVSEADTNLVRPLAEQICAAMIREILALPGLVARPGQLLTLDD